MYKVCIDCGMEKDMKLFHICSREKDGRDIRCAVCRNSRNRKRYMIPEIKEKHRVKIQQKMKTEEYKLGNKERNNNWYNTPRGRGKTIMKGVIDRVKKNGYPLPDFDENHIIGIIENGVCQLTGLPFVLNSQKDGNKRAFSPSIDKIDPNKPYMKDNIRIVLWQVNLMKGELNDEELVDFCYLIIDSKKYKEVNNGNI